LPADNNKYGATHCLGAPASSQAVCVVGFLLIGIALAWLRTLHLDEAAALYGYSPSALFHPVWNRPEFSADFPNGEAEMMKSLVGQAYHLLGALPFPRRLLVAFMIFAEYSALGGGAFLCARRVNPTLPQWTAVVAAMLLTTGALISCDLARWFHPYYGSAYNFAYAFGLAAMAAMLARKPVWAGLCIGLGAAVHPIIALFFGIAVATVALHRLAEFRLVRLIAGGVVALVIAAGWSIMMLGNSGIAGESVDPNLYIGLMRLMSFHWFPITIGVFGDRAFETFIPFTGFLLVVAALVRPFPSTDKRFDVDLSLALGIVVLLVVAAVGVFSSEYSGVPLLIKLALHRASSVVLLLGAVIVVPRLAADVVTKPLVRAALAAALLLSAFWRDHGPPILLCIFYALAVLYHERRDRSRAELILIVGAFAVVVGIATIFATTYSRSVLLSVVDLRISALSAPLFMVAFALAGVSWKLRMPVVLAAGIAAGALAWLPQVDPLRDPAELQRATAFLQAQEWARSNTPPDALFMVDPTYSYSWRDMAERPSFGSLRDWLYAGWGYNTRASVMKEGLSRARWLGLDLDRYLSAKNVTAAYSEMGEDTKRLYNTMSEARLAETAARYRISYFVFDRQNMKKLPHLPIAFENSRYVVFKAER